MVKKIFQKIIKKPHLIYVFAILALAFIIYFPSLSTFYTNDDFFHLRIANVNSAKDIVNFFNLSKAPEGWGLYRPLTTQVFYFLAWKVFNLNPIGLHIVSFFFFFAVIFLVYRLCLLLFINHKSLFTNHISLLAAFLYATSASHFGHLYFLGAFQELGMAFFFLLAVIYFIKFLQGRKPITYLVTFFAFLLSLLSKETAIVLPLILILVYWLLRLQGQVSYSFKNLLISLAPYFSLLLLYLYFRIASYGFAQGESYVWDFSIGRAINTLGWYGLWSFNLPETLVDFVGPGLHLNPNLFKYWSSQIIPILVLFAIELLAVLYWLLKSELLVRKSLNLILFCLAWFVITVLPVLFLPLHKFTFYLTLPLIGVVIVISYLLSTSHKSLITLFLVVWLSVSVFALNLTRQTNWITRGALTARNVHNYLVSNQNLLVGYRTIAFYDTEKDFDLPWRPSEVLKVTLSDQNYFKVFWNDKLSARYYNSEEVIERGPVVKIKARPFLGY